MNCSKCVDFVKNNGKTGTSVFSALFIAIVPKCSFCVMAYSSAIAMCGGGTMYGSENNLASYIPIVLAAIIMIMIGVKPKGYRTFYALLIALIGFLMILGVHQTWIDSVFYTWGNIFLFIAIWVNGSFLSIMEKIRKIGLKPLWQK